jgi:hypothetical protein
MGKIETWKVYGVIVLISILNIIITNNIISDDIYINTYTGQLSAEIINKMLSIKSKYSWASYVLAPILLILKTGFVSICFWIGSLFNDSNDLKTKFKDYLRIVIFAESVFIIFSFVRTGLLYNYNFQTLTEINQFQPFTLSSVLNTNNIPAYFHYPLTLLSIPEAVYWIVLALLLKPIVSGNLWNRIGFIAKTYGVGLLIWVSIVVFLTLNFSA